MSSVIIINRNSNLLYGLNIKPAMRYSSRHASRYSGFPGKLRFPSVALLAAVFAMTGFPGIYGHANAQEPVTVDAVDTLENRLPYDEKEAQGIDGMLMCPVCPSQTIGQSQVTIAKQMRWLVREKLGQGKSREEILGYFAGVYGQDILAAPPKTGFSLIAWTVPVFGVFAALAAGFFVLRSMRTGPGMPGMADNREDLEPYLEAVDRALGITEFQGSKDIGESNGDEDGVNRGVNG